MQKEILEEAIGLKASDIHFEPTEKTVQIRYRIDGWLIKGPIFPSLGPGVFSLPI